jgi:hypothetical protein
MSDDAPIGHITLRIPIFKETDSESWEIPQEYTYLVPGDAELVSHDVPSHWHDFLREHLIESGVVMGEWTTEHITATCTLPDDEAALEPPALTLIFPKEP